MIENKLYRLKTVIETLGISRSKIYELADEGKLVMTKELPRRVTGESMRNYYISQLPADSGDPIQK